MRRLRAYWLAFLTAFGIPRGIFIPYRYAKSLSPSHYSYLAQWLFTYEASFLQLLQKIEHSYTKDLLTILAVAPPPEPRWHQDWFTGLDGVLSYGLVRLLKPRTIMEIGCGHSTRFLCKAIRDENSHTQLIAIDPHPRATLTHLPITFLRQQLQSVSRDQFSVLQEGDILFVDSSHIVVPGSDLDILFSEIIPQLPVGVYLHFHDIFLPHDYPAVWKWRNYNEQQIVAAALCGGGFQPIFASRYLRTQCRQWCEENTLLSSLPFPSNMQESSLWLRKTCNPLVTKTVSH